MSNDLDTVQATPHKYMLYSAGSHDDKGAFFDLVAERDIEIDERGTGPHCRALLPWALERVRESRHEIGLFCAEFSPLDEHGIPNKALAAHYFTWGIGPVFDGEAPNPDGLILGA